MPPRVQVDRAKIIEAVMKVIEEDGWQAVTARAVAHRLGVSTQPIYREFKDMDALKDAAKAQCEQEYVDFVAERCSNSGALSQSIAYVRFAAEHSSTFKIMFESRSFESGSLTEMKKSLNGDIGIIEMLEEITGLQRDKVYDLHFAEWMALHGLACIAASNDVGWHDEEISDFVKTLSRALTKYYKEEAK